MNEDFEGVTFDDKVNLAKYVQICHMKNGERIAFHMIKGIDPDDPSTKIPFNSF